MWINNVNVSRVYASSNSKNAWAIVTGGGWRKIRTLSTDGVTNCLAILTAARAHNRTVSVYVVSNEIERVML